MPISSYVSCLETNSIMSCSYSEVPAAQQKIARRGSGEPVDCVGGWPLGFSGAKQLTVRVSSGPPSVLWVRDGHLCSHRRRRQQQQRRRWQVWWRLQPEMIARLRLQKIGWECRGSIAALRIGGNNRFISQGEAVVQPGHARREIGRWVLKRWTDHEFGCWLSCTWKADTSFHEASWL